MENLNIPNTLSVIRIIALIPMFIIGLDRPFLGALIAAILGITDFVDAIGTIIIFIKKLPRPDVNKLGKISAFGAMVATPSWVVVYTHYGLPEKLFLVLALLSTIVSIPTGYISLYEYSVIFKKKT